jgi:hypothetical protein
VRIGRVETFVVEAGVACWAFLKLYTNAGVTEYLLMG